MGFEPMLGLPNRFQDDRFQPLSHLLFLETAGIEPTSSVCKTDILPINYAPFFLLLYVLSPSKPLPRIWK